MSRQPVFRFAPSPNGFLHLGHAYSALLNADFARRMDGRFLLRIEDIDIARCRDDLVQACLEDLAWLGLEWEAPVLRQSMHFGRYRAAAADLEARGLVYPCFCSRKDIAEAVDENLGRDPDGAPVYPGRCRGLDPELASARRRAGVPHALRLDMAAALAAIGEAALVWNEGSGENLDRITTMKAQPARWGDVVLVRKECPTSYHLSVVLDDALQGVTHIVRGADLFEATAVHRVLQALLGLAEPIYHHHALVKDETGHKLAKSALSKPLRQWRAEGASPADIRHRLGFA